MKDWNTLLEQEHQQAYYQDTLSFVTQRRAEGIRIYPAEDEVFAAFNTPNFDDIKVVMLGQDPYHGAGQAHGLCFSVQPNVKIPPSLVNMYKELANDIDGFVIPTHGYLGNWAEQGVFMLNTVLTVEEGKAHSHKHLGWEQFTDKVIATINEHLDGVVFILWGAHAHKKGKSIDESRHHILAGPHPSPLSAYRGFFGCKHFSATNKLLIAQGKTPINWQV